MKLSTLVLPFAAFALVPVATHAEEPQASETKAANAYIAFANNGGVRDWTVYDNDTLYFQDRQRHWYKAELMSPAFDLPFTQFLGIDSGPTDRLDKWSTIYVRGQRYALRSFEPIEGKPPKKVKKAKQEKVD